MLPIFLASTSPRRHELLNQVGIPHQVMAVSIDESQFDQESAITYIERMVSQKAHAAAKVLAAQHAVMPCLVITADTIGVLASGQVLQKPKDYQDACAMWRQMSDSSHEVWTALQVSRVDPTQPTLIGYEQVTVKTSVNFVALTQAMMEEYWQTGEPRDKAGGYAIQGRAGAWVKAIHGSYSNVVGLPLAETVMLLNNMA